MRGKREKVKRLEGRGWKGRGIEGVVGERLLRSRGGC